MIRFFPCFLKPYLQKHALLEYSFILLLDKTVRRDESIFLIQILFDDFWRFFTSDLVRELKNNLTSLPGL